MSFNPPGALSSQGWDSFYREFKEKAPIRYWFKNSFQRGFIYPIKWKITRASDWIAYRTYRRYHIVDTGLKPGYHDVVETMLHVNFNLLKDFVECELAWTRFRWEEEAGWRNTRFMRILKRAFFRDPELGLEYLLWASTLDSPHLPPSQRCDHQAIAARETHYLYDWWVNRRPARKDLPLPVIKRNSAGLFDMDFDRKSPEYKEYVDVLDQQNKLEEKWIEEDNQMLVRLVKIRTALWT